MADISNVQYEQIKDIIDGLEALSCKSQPAHSALVVSLTLMNGQLAS